MRADRLLSILLMLQRRRRMTALQLATELEVSERTIYRDIDALAIAGVPVYGEPGPDGGYALLDDFRTFLTGLTDAEMQALFMLNVPAPLSDLGIGQSLKSALVKVFASMPDAGIRQEHWIEQRFLMDTEPWPQTHAAISHLPAIQQAIWQDRRVLMRFRTGPLSRDVAQIADPLSLVAAAGAWYMVYAIDSHIRAMPIAGLRGVVLLEESFGRPQDYDLKTFWADWRTSLAANTGVYAVTLRVSGAGVPDLRQRFAEHVDGVLAATDGQEQAGWYTMTLPFDSLEDARRHLLAFGGAVEVIAPAALRESLHDYARQIVAVYE